MWKIGLEIRMRGFFLLLVICLLIASANLGLVNNALAVKASDGGNLLGVRDVLIVAALAVGTLRIPRSRISLVINRLSALALLIVLLTPSAMLVGLLNAGPLLSVARDGFMMLGWLLTPVVASNLRDRRAVRVASNVMLLIGLLVAVGVFVEAASHGQIRLVTPADVVSRTGRSTPSGWPLMMISSSMAQVSLLLESKASPRDSWFRLIAWATIVIASLLTQSRTLLVGIGASTVVFLVFLLKTNPRRGNWIRIVPILVGIPVAVAATLALGNAFVRPDFSGNFLKRYSVLTSVDSLIQHSGEDGRTTEVELGFRRYIMSPLLGVGLGSEYRDYMPEYYQNDSALTVHNVLAFFLFRYGPLGLASFLMLVYQVLGSLSRSLKERSSDLSTVGVGLSVGMINLFACAFFGNVFGTTYGTPQAMIALGCLAAYEQLTIAESRTSCEACCTRQITRPAKVGSDGSRIACL